MTDQELAVLYKKATATIMPSLMEGYGLPGIESLALGTPVVASNIPVFREVYGERAEYFEPTSAIKLIKAVTRAAAKPRKIYPSVRTWLHVAKSIAEVASESSVRLR